MTILIKNVNIYTDDGVKFYKFMCIDDGIIKHITDDVSVVDSFKKHHNKIAEIDACKKLIMPGLVNTHTHSPMTALRNIGSDLPLHRWLFEEIFPREAKFKPESIYYGSLLGQIEMIRSGTIEFTDMYPSFDSLAQAVEESGLRASISVELLHNDWSTGRRITGSSFKEGEKTIEKWKGRANGRITFLSEIHSVYLYDHSFLKDVVDFSKSNNIGINMHLQETQKEVEDSIKELNVRPVEFFDSIGAFDVPVTAAHCVHMNSEEMQLLKKKGVIAAINLTSNLKLASGIPNLPEMLKVGVNVGFGTDGCASNNNLNMFEEMHLAGILYKGLHLDSTMVSPKQVIKAATLGRKIAEGEKADLIMIDMKAPHLHPVNDVDALIVYAMQGSDVDTVIVNGEILMENKVITRLDEEKIIYEVDNIKFV